MILSAYCDTQPLSEFWFSNCSGLRSPQTLMAQADAIVLHCTSPCAFTSSQLCRAP
ncbi:hypothetical protein KCP74_16515 [Salmonella enterica subsp. enterica]|nr:hypothetical protein KCP74_16515 [Salmonella enterica subsp. enterica]